VKPLACDREDARRFMRRATALDTPLPDVGSALAHLGFAQIDPINVCGRMHDLVLRNRVAGYREGDLQRHLHPERGERPALEHFLPGQGILAAFPVQDWRFLAPHARERARSDSGFSGKLDARQRRLARRVLGEIAARGALMPEEIAHDEIAESGWGTRSRAVKVVMEKLLVHGELLISERRGFRRVYDLAERVLPAAVRAAPPASLAETRRWRVLTRLRQRRLVRLARADLEQVHDAVQAVSVPDCPPLWCLREDLPLFNLPPDGARAAARLLAPLDPLIYDRVLTTALWSFDYTWEVYTPPAKRRRGYYALPLLAGTEIVGHVDPKADRAAGRLRVVSRRVRRGHASAPAVRELAAFLGLR
jgi:uncharacterized protein YcaQ